MQADDAARKDAIKQGQAIFTFKLKNGSGKEEAWHIDMKETGTVAKGEAPSGKKPDGELDMAWNSGAEPADTAPVVLSLSDENFGKMVSGKTKAQQLFMSGKLKIKGNVMKGEVEVRRTAGYQEADVLQRRRWSPYCRKRSRGRSYECVCL